MAQCTLAAYKCKIRVNNNIFQPLLTAEEFEDVRTKGLDSGVVKIFLPADATSTVIGQFKYPLEILSVAPVKCSRPGPAGEGVDGPQAMEFEVNIT